MTTGFSPTGSLGAATGGLGAVIPTIQYWAGGHPAGSGRAGRKAAMEIALATLRQLELASRQGELARRVAVAQSPLMEVTQLTPSQYRRVSHLRFAIGQAGGVGDKTKPPKGNPAQVAIQQERLARVTASAPTVLVSRYGLNNPLLAGSRDDPRGVTRPPNPFLFARRFGFYSRFGRRFR